NEWKAHSGLATLQRVSKHWREAGSEYRAAIDIIERERSKIRYDELKFTFLSSLIRFYQEYVDFLMDRGQTQRAFEVAASSRARVLSEKLHTSALTRTKAAARLHRLVANTQTILASYWLAPGRSFLWVIDESGLRAFILPPEEEIASKVISWRKAVLESDSEDTPNEAGQWLNHHLISDHFTVPRNYTLVVAPDGSLFELNFEALPTGRNGGYWIDKTTIAVAPAPSLLRSLEHPKNDYLLLIGDPDFESAEFPRLAHLNKEMSDISSQFTKKDVYRGAAATPEAYRRAPTAHYSVVHFAAHAVASWDNPLDSAILLSGGVNHKLYARDITRYPLHAGLVTLSACQTAGKRTYAGEGLTGLAWAFLSAGAAQVVAGLWDVDDRATSSLMSRFYTSIQSGELPVRALRSAKLSLMRSSNMYRNPLYWAGFEVFTNGVYRGSPI
ncbi:MAG TPA: CHAT domain-containing protein, partial [Pyrinomonadaceae bacterium]|nr:CHAT domain-containing protein [Pyrinomonadaceae bacterium]